MDTALRADLIFLAVEVFGVSITATLLGLLAHQTRLQFARCWAYGWVALAISLGSLLAWTAFGQVDALPLAPFVAGGSAFALLVARGFTVYARGPQPRRVIAWLVAGCCAWAVALVTIFSATPNAIVVTHVVVMVALLALALDRARRVEAPGPYRVGLRFALASLVAMIVDLVVFGMLSRLELAPLAPMKALLPFHALADLVLLTGLGFGQVLLVMETVSAELAETNRELAAARDRLQEQATVDPLTKALNRHAFQSLVGEPSVEYAERAGCVAVIDIDNLKRLNDTRGHAAGDEAIRAAAATIRRMIRADDLLFRWGGDEFLAVLFGISEDGAKARLRALTEHQVRDASVPALSWGVSPFRGLVQLGEAIESADRQMYDGRARRRAHA